jgi:hypothetical protein
MVVIEIVPETLPDDLGAKTTSAESDCPGWSVSADNPLTLNPEPVIAERVIVTFEFPALITFRGSELLLPTATSPKFSAEGLASTVVVEAIPFPDAGTVRPMVLPEALKSTDAEPVIVPVLAGLKTTLNVELLPAPICRPLASPEILRPVPETDSEETDTVVLP